MSDIEKIAAELTEKWAANEYAIHKRPPYRAHNFDRDERYWVVGTTCVSVLHGRHGSKKWADGIAKILNETPAVRAHLENSNAG